MKSTAKLYRGKALSKNESTLVKYVFVLRAKCMHQLIVRVHLAHYLSKMVYNLSLFASTKYRKETKYLLVSCYLVG